MNAHEADPITPLIAGLILGTIIGVGLVFILMPKPNATLERLVERTPLDERALGAFETLHGNLRPGPLADAIKRLLAHHRS